MSRQDATPPFRPGSDASSDARQTAGRIPRRWLRPRRRAGAGAGVVILQHQDNAPPGLLLDVLKARGLARRTVRVDRAEHLPDPSSIALAVVLGSDESADRTRNGWIAAEMEWLRRADQAGTTILGLGFGAQALALALGGAVEPTARPARGWKWVSTTEPQTIARGPWFAWHDDAIRIPPGAQLLAHNGDGPQAYRAGNHLGIQFHPEVTPAIITERVYGENTHALDTQGVLEATSREFKTAAVAATQLFSAFADSVDRLHG
jgi:GMP synthase (glutamine-hydrolysing)